MKMFTVETGTLARVIHVETNRDVTHRTTKRNVFFDTVIDPIAHHNGRRSDNDAFNNYAATGFAIFQNEDQPNWYLVVPYKNVRVN